MEMWIEVGGNTIHPQPLFCRFFAGVVGCAVDGSTMSVCDRHSTFFESSFGWFRVNANVIRFTMRDPVYRSLMSNAGILPDNKSMMSSP